MCWYKRLTSFLCLTFSSLTIFAVCSCACFIRCCFLLRKPVSHSFLASGSNVSSSTWLVLRRLVGGGAMVDSSDWNTLCGRKQEILQCWSMACSGSSWWARSRCEGDARMVVLLCDCETKKWQCPCAVFRRRGWTALPASQIEPTRQICILSRTKIQGEM